ncbi:L,D-transpeptidase catalytic domain [Thalassovita gelatinovora]|uniref:L,D-transpeptidase catalytic domain n=1 Tax=Thalassovita gelatinovora TaxID=53501 RepID=A0A0N7LV03_THAGE|nr:L,D-transpeptidase family protein [Thalassovita gelatinovora]QIZ81080.1 L,D-transpeptidase family protein [Thalassovita gelatinovora]CUH64938.1 L,D-transpeptidase catalytic domain [Thalassovita gelatinovora]SEP89227.1 L,D-transpeptidase catalytic domain [Thalassovita gelatinovora]
MRVIKLLMMAVVLFGLAACSTKFKTYKGEEVTGVVVQKQKRMMHLVSKNRTLKSYQIGLGFAPDGDKIRRGDGRTPEGHYRINRRNPNSQYYLSLGISYPNDSDRQIAVEAGDNPGGDIFIHGRPQNFDKKERDWTAGCIAVTNREIEEIYAMVRDGTPISIYP